LYPASGLLLATVDCYSKKLFWLSFATLFCFVATVQAKAFNGIGMSRRAHGMPRIFVAETETWTSVQ
jgi:hypothetical protein